MAQFIMMIGGAPLDADLVPAADYARIKGMYSGWVEKIEAKATLVDSNKLKDGEGRRVLSKNGQAYDGPFVESKETICGYFIVEAESYEDVAALARENPTVLEQGGFVEIRRLNTGSCGNGGSKEPS